MRTGGSVAICVALGLVVFVVGAVARAGTDTGSAGRDAFFFPAGQKLESPGALEVSFRQPMVAPESVVGRPATESPLVFLPSVSGDFVWTSENGGTFAPSGPLPLGRTWTVSLRPGLRDAAGKPLEAEQRRTLQTIQTPPMRVSAFYPSSFPSWSAQARPRIMVLFNAAVSPVDAAKFIAFEDSKGVRIPAEVRLAERGGYFPVYDVPGSTLLTWREAFAESKAPAGIGNLVRRRRHSLSSEIREGQANVLVATPAAPLCAGDGWTLVVAQGLPAAGPDATDDGAATHGAGRSLHATARLVIGDLPALAVRKVEARNTLNETKHLELTFSRRVDELFTPENAGRWITVSPAPAEQKFAISGDTVRIDGQFRLGVAYAVNVTTTANADATAGAHPSAVLGVRPGAAGQIDRLDLAQDFSARAVFEPIPSRLYFQEITTHQARDGSRKIPLLAVNVPEVRLRAKQLDATTVVPALKRFDGYERGWRDRRRNYDGDEPFRGIDFDPVDGRLLFDQRLPGSAEVDEQKTLPLPWDEMLGRGGDGDSRDDSEGGGLCTGAVLISAEEAPREQEITAPRKGTQTLVQLTDLGVVWKGTAREAVVHVFSHASGRPVPGATVRLVDDENRTLHTGRTDAQGVTSLPADERGKWLVAENGRDFHVVGWGERRENLSLYHFDELHDHHGEFSLDDDAGFLRGDGNSSGSRLRLMLFSDRGIYRPGETVLLKGIVRAFSPDGLALPAGRKGTVTCTDPRGRTFFTREFAVSAAGAFSETIELPTGVIGRYRARVRFHGETETAPTGGSALADGSAGRENRGDAENSGDGRDDEWTHAFQVEEYEPNAFEIAVETPKHSVTGEALRLPVAAKYFMGKPLSKAKLRWSLEAADGGFEPAGFSDYYFCAGRVDMTGDGADEIELDHGPSQVSLQGEGALSDRGEFLLAPEVATNPRMPQPRSISVLAEITDMNEQTVSRSVRFTRHSSDFYLGLKKFDGVLLAGETLPVELVAVRAADGQPVVEPVAATVRLTRIHWNTNRIEGAGHAAAYRSEPELETVAQFPIQTTRVRKAGAKWIAAPAAKTAAATSKAPGAARELRPDQPGLYLVEARARDGAGRDVVTIATLHVTGQETLAWDYKNDFAVELVADREDYLAGETATLLLKSPMNGWAWVTVEREKVLRSFSVRVEGNAPAIRVPIEPGDAPNVFVSVLLLRGSEESARMVKAPDYRLGFCRLKVTNPKAKLLVHIEPERRDYEPAQEVHIMAQVKDAAGVPAPGAEVTLYAVDEGVLSLTGYTTPDPFAFFNAARPHAVETGLTLPKLLPEDPDELSFGNKGFLVGGGGEGGDGEWIRKNFRACAFWSAELRADLHGRVRAVFPAPDSLTRYRLVAVAHTARSQFGSGEASFEVSKPLMLQPALPRFAHVGDRIGLRAVLHNATDTAGEVELSLELDGIATSPQPLVRRVQLAARGSLAVDFPVEFTGTGEAKWTWRAQMVTPAGRVLTDSVQSTLNVNYPAPLLQEVHASCDNAREANLLAPVNRELLTGSGTVRVSISHSRVIEMGEPLRQLLHYPYGCVEQTTSSMLPWIALHDFQTALPDLRRSPREIDDAVQRGVNRLFTMQCESGGFGYWPGADEPLFWGSAYAGMGLALAKRAGHFVPPERFERLRKYLSEGLRNSTSDKFDPYGHDSAASDRCLAVYALALAGVPEPAYHESLFNQRHALSAENRALLALAISESGGPREMIDTLLGDAAPGSRVPRSEDDPFYSAARDTAMRLLVWSRHAPANAKTGALLNALFDERRSGHWLTTQGNVWSLLAVANYIRCVERPQGAVRGALAWGSQVGTDTGGEARSFGLDAGSALHETIFRLDPSKAREPLKLLNPDGAKLFTRVTLEVRPRSLEQSRAENGYALRRTYAKIADDGTLSALDEPQVGDRVLVTLEIDVRRPARYVAVNDPLPAIFEAVNPAFKTQATRAGEALSDRGDDWFIDFRELREDRALFFCDYLSPGKYAIRYLARVRAAGTATAPGARIEEMYRPDRFGQTESRRLTSHPLPL